MPTPEPPPAPVPSGPWARWRQAHLWDYPPPAERWFLGLAAAGLLGALAALAWLLQASPTQQLHTVLGLALAVLGGLFPVRFPRSTHCISVTDVCVFLLMANVSVPAAALAGALDSLVGSLRTSRRLTSRVGGPSASLIGVVVAGAVFEGLRSLLPRLGWPAGAVDLVALCLAAPVWSAVCTALVLAMMARKQGRRLDLATWLGTTTWLATVSLASALVVGLVQGQVHTAGLVVLPVAAATVAVLALLLRSALGRAEAEHRAQEAQVAAARHDAELNQRRFTAAFTHAAIGMAIVQADGKTLQANQALADLLGLAPDQLVGRPFSEVLEPGESALLERHSLAVLAQLQASFSMELRCRARTGDDLWVALHCGRYEDPGDAGHCLIYQLHDITSRHLAESRLHHIAYHDGLTDLANRSCFHERLEVAVERSRLDMRLRFAVMFLDLDRFKLVNDSLGHMAGNELLREVARRLRACVRPGDLVARLGGDEFAVLLENLGDLQTGLRLAERLLETLSQPLSIGGTEVLPAASLGITFSDGAYRSVDEVLRDADLAMYEAKAGGRGRVALFDSSMHERASEKLLLEADLRHAIDDGALALQFQPIVDLRNEQITGFEALARWLHPGRGAISPAVFIALAEETGQIEALTAWVLEQAVAQLARWHRRWPQRADLQMNVNISGRDLQRPGFAAQVQAVLVRHAVPPAALTLEITETTLMSRLDAALVTLQALRETGVRFSIDDFGTGHSSLAYLSTLPIDSLKIDRSFVTRLCDGPQNVEIVRAVLNLGASLNRKVVAEGIETAEQLAMLRRLGVPFGQGYLFARPLRVDQADALLGAPEAFSSTVSP